MVLFKEDIAELVQQEENFAKEDKFSEEISIEIFPYLDEITKDEITNHQKLKKKLDLLFLTKIKKKFNKFKDIIFSIFQVSFSTTTGGFIILDSAKFLSLIKDKISGKEIIELIKKTPEFIINPLCSLVNIINERKFNLPEKIISDLATKKILPNQIFPEK